MKNKIHYRQGDVLIERIESLPELSGKDSGKQKPSRRIILALGEATGHHHCLESKDPADWWKRDEGIAEEQFVVVTGQPAHLTHQEHATIVLPPGKYRVTKQREYSPEAIRNVAD